MKIKTLLMLFLTFTMAVPAHAFQCYITAMKGDCWSDYEVTIEVLDSMTDQTVLDNPIQIKKGSNYQRVAFQCKPQQGLRFIASFSPAIWKSNEKKQYNAQRIWYLPSAIKKGITAWNLPICFASDFASVPIPPQANSLCGCEKVIQTVPALEVKAN